MLVVGECSANVLESADRLSKDDGLARVDCARKDICDDTKDEYKGIVSKLLYDHDKS